MRARQQKGNSSAINNSTPPGREERFWPFDEWDPNDDDGKPGSGSSMGDGSGPSSLKNYPSSSRGPDREN
jgi:hypothetical protein